MARVLIVDDDKSVALMIFGLLEETGHTPVLARSERVVFDDLERCAYDVVVTDLNMPAVSGWQVADWVEQHRPTVPVIALSGALAGVRNEDEFNRFAAVMSKANAPHAIGQMVDVVLELSHR